MAVQSKASGRGGLWACGGAVQDLYSYPAIGLSISRITMRFYDRKAELESLERACSGKGAEMIVVSGRRRIGKSRLIDEFLRGKDHAEILVVPKEEKQVAADFASALAEGYAPTFSTVVEALEYFFSNSRKRIMYIDEFPNLLDVNRSIPYELQKVWEKYKDKTSKILILSGSYVGMMNRLFTQQKAPLFNRAGHRLLLQPLSFKIIWEIQRDLGIGAQDKIRNYCILGGVPYYYELLEKQGTRDVVDGLFFDVAAPLKEEGQNVLRQEFGSAYRKYFSIIEAIGGGLVSSGEIANRLGVSQTTLSKYIMSLQRDFQIVERTVPFGQAPLRSKKGVYSIKDSTMAFWFAYVYGRPQPPENDALNEFISRRFEAFCREFLAEYLTNLGESVVSTGKWWGRLEAEPGKFEEREIDVVVETKLSVFAGECKWTNGKVGSRELGRLAESSKALRTKKPIRKVLFSKSGFDLQEAGETLLFDPERIGAEIGKMR